MDKGAVYLKKIKYPEFEAASPIIYPSVSEIENRIEKCRIAMRERGLTHLVIYGDREHFANIMYLAHFDPRFEEALLIIKLTGTPLVLVGNEGIGHLTVSPLYNAKKIRYERYQSFSLVSQPRNESSLLEDILKCEGIDSSAAVGCVGWKYFTKEEFSNYKTQIDIPAFIVDTLRSLCGYKNVTNATDILISPQYGLKTSLSLFEIAHFEWVNTMASDGVRRILQNFRPDITDFELASEYQYTGYPLGCHVGIKSSGNQHIGLSSPVGAKIVKGEPCSFGLAYWGSNICRAGWVVKNEEELPESAKGYVQNFAAPYFYACCRWYANMKIGTQGKVFRQLIDELLPFDDYAVYLNPGHLIHFEEWMSSPIYNNSIDTIKSGMYIQVDIIPRSRKYFSSRMEDGIVIADKDLRTGLKENYPETYHRCMARRKFMIDTLGIDLPEEVLPLSNIPAIVPPFLLNCDTVLSLKP
jgi:Xaa-Pro aminopeptidase